MLVKDFDGSTYHAMSIDRGQRGVFFTMSGLWGDVLGIRIIFYGYLALV